MKCCICGKEFHGWGNNPRGSLTTDGVLAVWKQTDVCCDECNRTKVLPSRMALLEAKRIKELANEDLAQVVKMKNENSLSENLYNILLQNWEQIVISK